MKKPRNPNKLSNSAALLDKTTALIAAPDAVALQFETAFTFHQQGHLAEAEALYREVLQSAPKHFDTLQLLATIALQKKNPADAVLLFDQVLSIDPNHPASLNNRGLALKWLKRWEDALESYNKAIAVKPDYAEAYLNRGIVLVELKRFEEALVNYENVVILMPESAELTSNRGNVLKELMRYDESLMSYDHAIALKPDYAEAYSNRGNVLKELKRYDESLMSYDHAIALKPDYAEACSNRGNVLKELKRYDESLMSYDHAIALKPDYAEACSNRGNVLKELMRYDESLMSYDHAIALKPDYAEAYYNRGTLLVELNRYDEALLSYNNALAFKPDGDFWFGDLMMTKMLICDWSNFVYNKNQLAAKIQRHEKVTTPFPLIALIDSPSLQQQAALIYINNKYRSPHSLPEIPKCSRHDKIRIGYYSADYYNHATANLIAELFEKHDRSKFELIGFSFGPDKQNDGMRKRLESAFDRFIDIKVISDNDVVLLSRDLEVDIAVDLNGFTLNARTGIFALRAAPIQVNYLVYPGTIGANYIDYLIADPMLIPESSQKYYTEKIAYLPDSYQVNDAKRRIADKVYTREELGLPLTGFVFCCFNNNYKITPTTFDGWMRILKQVEGSVLWLLEDNPKAASNLRMEALQRGVDAERLLFAKRMPLPEHLARHRLADLFLDTFPCNAHTTASDALWAGLPVLTCIGESFPSRVAASLLKAIHLPQLITSNQEEYEALAIDLATTPKKLDKIKHTLDRNRLTTPLFDTRLFTQHIEEAYTEMYERFQADLPCEHIYICGVP